MTGNACLAEYDIDGWTAPDLCSFEHLREGTGEALNSSPSAAGICWPTNTDIREKEREP